MDATDPEAPDATARKAPSPYLKSRGLLIPKDGNIVTGRIRGALRKEGYEGKEANAVLKLVTEQMRREAVAAARPSGAVVGEGAGAGAVLSSVALMTALLARRRRWAGPRRRGSRPARRRPRLRLLPRWPCGPRPRRS